MDSVIFTIIRRMRFPLMALTIVYSIAVLGFTLIPAQDANGNPVRMGFFDAFYFVSYTATTIGFGELPHPFTPAQRLWTIVCIYATVIVWIYSIGTLISLAQDAGFSRAVTRRRFRKRVRELTRPFYLVCGYGETGTALLRALIHRNQMAVVIDVDPKRIAALKMENYQLFVPALCADAGVPAILREAGLKHDRCIGVVAVTDDNEINLKISITAKLLHEDITVYARSDSSDVEKNMESFETDNVVDPYETFALHLAIALEMPCQFLIHRWLSGLNIEKLEEPVYPPATGLWVICGFGRFGKAIYSRLKVEGVGVIVIEATPDRTGEPAEGCIKGRGTEAETLKDARIESAVALVAGTNDDTNNLSIVMTAKELNSRLFVVLRQNELVNQDIIDAVHADIVMHPSAIIANRIRVMMMVPLLREFIVLAKMQENAWACELASRISALVGDEAPDVWEVCLKCSGLPGDRTDPVAVIRALADGQKVRLAHLMHDPRKRHDKLRCLTLLLKSEHGFSFLPKPETALSVGDRILFCGSSAARDDMEWTLQNENILRYSMTGKSRSPQRIWKVLARGLGGRH